MEKFLKIEYTGIDTYYKYLNKVYILSAMENEIGNHFLEYDMLKERGSMVLSRGNTDKILNQQFSMECM